jgi:hypothetical protein
MLGHNCAAGRRPLHGLPRRQMWLVRVKLIRSTGASYVVPQFSDFQRHERRQFPATAVALKHLKN